MATRAAVRVHIRDDVKGRRFAQSNRHRIIASQEGQRAFHPPFGHGLAGMLTGIEPDLHRTIAEREKINVAAIEGLAKHLVTDTRQGSGLRHQCPVSLR